MKKTNRLSRLLAMLLALAMLVNSQGMTSMAAVIGGVTGGKKQTEAPQTETEPATEAVAQTEAQEPESAAETEPESESESLTPAETEIESESESEGLTAAEMFEEETESESETVNEQTVFTYEDDEKVVTATLADPAAVPAGAEFVVEDLTPEEFDAYKAIIAEQLMAEMDAEIPDADKEIIAEQMLAGLVLYDMHFVCNGEEIEPDDSQVSVSIVNKVAVPMEVPEVVEGEENLYVIDQEADAEDTYTVVHIKEDGDDVQVEDVTENVQTNAAGDVKTVEFKTDSFSVFASYPQLYGGNVTVELIDDTMTNYSLHYILNNFNLFCKGQATVWHTVGAVAVGGFASFSQSIGMAGYKHSVYSYFGDSTSLAPHKGGDGRGNITDINMNYQVDSGMGIVIEAYDATVPSWKYEQFPIKIHTPEAKYIDFDKAFQSIITEANGYANDPSNINVDISVPSDYYSYNNGTLKVKSGYNYEFTSFEEIKVIDVQIDEKDEKNAGNINIINKEEEISGVPQIYINGKGGEDTLKSLVGDIQIGTGCGAAFIFPNATDVDYAGSTDTLIGHVVAPKAYVHGLSSGNTNGCFVVDHIESGAEGHMWPYNGSLIKPAKKGFSAKKTVNGGTPNSTEKFTFILEEFDKDKKEWKELERTTNDGESIVFNTEISYREGSEGTYWYLVSEEETPVKDYTLSNVIYAVKVEVTKKEGATGTTPEIDYDETSTYYTLKTGVKKEELILNNAQPNESKIDESKLNRLGNDKEAVVFNNTKDVKTEFKVEKEYDDDTAQDKKFTFTLTSKNSAPMPDSATGNTYDIQVSAADSAMSFGEIAYPPESKEYEYTIQEKIPDTKEKGIKYDENVYDVKVSVLKDEKTGEWVADVSYFNKELNEWLPVGDAFAFTFVNTKEKKGSLFIDKSVTVNGQSVSGSTSTIADGKYTFDIYKAGDFSQVIKTVDVIITNGQSNTATVSELEAGEYVVRERATENGTTLTSGNNIHVFVTADVNTKVEGETGNVAHFTNNKETGKTELKVKKNYESQFPEGGFSFVLEAINDAPMPAGSDGSKKTVQVSDTSEATFGNIEYTEDGTYQYKIYEDVPADLGEDNTKDGVTYDPTVYEVTVEVDSSENGQGKIVTVTSDPELPDGIAVFTFTNTYEEEGSVQFRGTKALTGGKTLEDNMFEFRIEGPGINTTVKNKGNEITFPVITYTEPGTYTYTISEVDGGKTKDGITYDGDVYTVTVTVSKHGSGGKFDISVTGATKVGETDVYTLSTHLIEVTEDSTSVAKEATFVNEYSATGKASIETTKELVGRDLSKGEFTFVLKESDEEWTTDGEILARASNDAGVPDEESGASKGTVLFTDFKTYTLDDLGGATEKTFYYVILEDTEGKTDVEDGGIAYDRDAVHVKVDVSDNGKGTLNAVAVIVDDKQSFINTYTANGSFKLNGNKELTGKRGEDVKEGEFNFEITDEDGKTVATGTTLAGGAIDFETIHYTLKDVGTHVYTVSEVIPKEGDENFDPTITYSTQSFEVKVLVLDRGNGTLVVSPSYMKGSMEFVNDYNATGSVPASGLKKVNGKAVTPEQIERLNKLVRFQLWRVDDTGYVRLESKSLEPDGTFKFTDLAYTQADIGNTYTYQMKEYQIADNDEMGGYTVDNTVYVFRVKVEDGEKHDGNLKLTLVDAEGNAIEGEPKLEAEFDNELTVEFHVNKTEVGDNSKEVEGAELEVLDKDGNVLDSWTSKKGETHDFGSVLEEGKSYTLREKVAPDGYAYTTDIEFSVTDNGEIETDMPKTTGENGETVYLVEDAPLHFNVNKVDLTNDEELDGATLTVYEVDENGEIVGEAIESWTSKKGETHDFGSSLKAGGSYVLREEAAPDGYAFTSDIPFTVGKDGTVEAEMRTTTNANGETVYLVDDKPLHFNVDKVDLTNDEELDGATLTVYEVDENGEIVGEAIESWTSKKGETHDFGSSLKAGGSYVLREEAAPDGYAFTSDIPFTVGEDGTVEAEMRTTKNADDETVYLVDDAPLHFNVDKVDLTNDEELDGATLTVYEVDENGEIVKDENGKDKVVDSWTSKKGETHDFGSSLKAGGSYVLREEAAPNGYAFTSDIPFTVGKDADGTVTAEMRTTTNAAGETVYLVEDKPLHFNVDKVDLTNDEELDGATLTVYEVDENGEIVKDENGKDKVVDSWTSKKGETHDFGSKLKAGGSYVLREEAAPNGYAFTSDIPFTVGKDADGTVTAEMRTTTNAAGETVYLVDDKPIVGKVTLTKLSEADRELLAGAAFQLYYKTDETESGWALYNNASYVTGIDGTLTVSGLTANDYYFVETEAPAGFVIATDENGEPMKYPFTIALDEADKTNAEVSVELDVTNAPDAKDTTLVVTKQLVFNDELWNAVDATFYVALFEDAELTKQVSGIQPIVFENSNTSSTTFENLEIGKTYYVAETDAEGKVLNSLGGRLATGELFRVDFYDDNVVTVNRGDGTKVIYFRNVFRDIPEEFYREGELTVTKQLLGADGTAKKSNKTFYAGIFDDAAFTQLSGKTTRNVLTLAMNGTSSVSDTVKVTVPEEGETTVYVTEVDKNGNPVAGAASFKYDVTVDGSTVTMDLDHLSASVTITNREREEESEEESEVFEEAESEGTVPASTKAVKTGDDTPIALYVGLLAAAALLLILAFVLKRRKKS